MSEHGSHGVQLLLGDGTVSPSYTAIAQLTSLTPPALERGHTVIASHDMTGAVRKFADALRNEGAVQAAGYWDPSNPTHDESTGIKSVANSGEERNLRIVFPDTDNSQFDFLGYVSNFQPGALEANSGLMTFTCTIEVSGEITET